MTTIPFPPRSWEGIDDVIIVGGGLAGLFCALKLSPRPVTVISGVRIGQGGRATRGEIAVALDDTAERRLADTIAAGAGLVDARVARGMAAEAADRLHDLLAYGHVYGQGPDGTIVATLARAARDTPSIRLMEGFVAESLRTDGAHVTGLIARDRRGGLSDRLLLPTRAVVLASGGIGHLYELTTSALEARGEGVAMAARAGALIADPEFVQFHPTALDAGRDPAPVIPETLQSEGAAIVDRAGRRFMLDIHPDGEFAPPDVVARAVHGARASGRGAFLDCRNAVGGAFAERYPTVHAACVLAGIDPTRQPIPIAPAAQYHLGGVHVDASGRSTLDGLWACGQVACTGLHGANRLASNALFESAVLAARVAKDVRGLLPNHKLSRWQGASAAEVPTAPEEDNDAIRTLRATMSRDVGVVRNHVGLTRALSTIGSLATRGGSPQLRNALAAAKLIAAAALRRDESRGSHCRDDFPDADRHPAARTFITLEKADAIAASVTEIPQKGYRLTGRSLA